MAANQVIIKGNPLQKEAIANESITPGHLIEFVGGSAATAAYLKKHATSGGNAQKMFANLQDYIGGGLTKVFASGDQVPYIVARRGDEVFALLKASENVGVGTLLESNGDGTLKAASVTSAGASSGVWNKYVAQAMDSSNVGAIARIRVEVL